MYQQLVAICITPGIVLMIFSAHCIIHRTSRRVSVPHDVLLGQLARCIDATLVRNSARELFTSSVPQSAESGSPPREKLRALPFITSVAQAQHSFAQFHRHNWFLSQITPTAEHVKEVYMPWWVVGARLRISVDSAQVGMCSSRFRLNRRTSCGVHIVIMCFCRLYGC